MCMQNINEFKFDERNEIIKYICIVVTDIKSKLKNHYRAHRLSFWLNLVPDLHKPGSDDVPKSHHLLDMDKVRFLLTALISTSF